MKARVITLMAFCLFLSVAILGRAAYIQVLGDPRLERMAKRQFQSKVLLRPRRGQILDRSGEALAVNVEVKSLAANPSKIQNERTMARLLSKALGVPYSRLHNRLKGDREFTWIKRHISDSEMNRLKKFGILGTDGDLMDGLWMVKESKRVYPHGEIAAHILGDVNLDSEGLEGVELWANEELRGKVVSVSAVKDALGRPTFIDSVTAQHAKEGESVTLTIDASLQFSAEQELRNAVVKSNAKGGTVIVMNAVTGEILAMANEPTFNPNHRGVPASKRRNRAVTDGFEPGSTMKPLLLASALQKGWKITDKIFAEHGSVVIQGKRISEAEAHEKFEWITLKKMIQVSSNVASAKLALKLGADHFSNTLKSLGFGSRTDIGFPGEISGRVPPRKSWQPLSLANIGFGQGILASPIQMLRAYATIANGGWLVQPTLLRSEIKGFKADPPQRVFSEKVTHGVTEAMLSVTEHGGTGTKAKVDGYDVAGKTGTAQMVDPTTGRYSRSRYFASFIGFPVGVDPKLVIYTSIEEPKGIYYASETAAPLFKAVLGAAANRFNLPSKPDTTNRALAQKPDSKDLKVVKEAAKPSYALISDKLQTSLAKVVEPNLDWQGTTSDGKMIWKMPQLQGLTVREAVRMLEGHKFELEVHGAGVIRSHFPDEGKPIADGSKLRLTLAEP